MSFLSHMSHHTFLPIYLYILIDIFIIYHLDLSEKQKLIVQNKDK